MRAGAHHHMVAWLLFEVMQARSDAAQWPHCTSDYARTGRPHCTSRRAWSLPAAASSRSSPARAAGGGGEWLVLPPNAGSAATRLRRGGGGGGARRGEKAKRPSPSEKGRWRDAHLPCMSNLHDWAVWLAHATTEKGARGSRLPPQAMQSCQPNRALINSPTT